MKRVIISGGGTGGHIYPAITIVNEIEKLEHSEFLYVGSKNGLESEIVPKAGIPFETLELQSLARRLTVQNAVALFKSTKAMVRATTIIRRFKPHVVIGTGGYVCGPMLLASSLMGVPTLIQEQNVIAGVTNKILSRFVDVVAIGYEEAAKSFASSKRVVYTGNPVRPEVISASREEGRRTFSLSDDDFAVLVAGGSRGARSINTAMVDVHRYFAHKKHIKLIHVTGSGEYKRLLEALSIDDKDEKGVKFGENSLILPYLHEMPKALAAADLAVFRAGAVGLAELTARGIPSILVPYPYAAEDHQTYNAKNLVINGAAKMIVDKMLTGEELIGDINILFEDRASLVEMASHSLRMGKPDAAKEIAKLALSIGKERV